MTKESQEIALRDEQALAAFGEAFDYKENADHILAAKVPIIKIQAQTGTFEFADEQDPEKRFRRSFESVIVDEFIARSYWRSALGKGSTEGSRPDCFSLDGKKPSSKVEDPIHPTCDSCPMAVYGSGEGGRRQACKLNRNLLIIDPTASVPLVSVLRLPPTSIKKVDAFFYELLKMKMSYRAAVVKFSLDAAKNKDGIAYSELRMERVGITPASLIPAIKQILLNVPALKVRIVGGTIEEASGGEVPF